ncbi:MAG: hypothetical protein HY902_18860 [Deltaproteobacteria bacterium]|nr:hypothetical protein [Deltaproteobacteria bacterium]
MSNFIFKANLLSSLDSSLRRGAAVRVVAGIAAVSALSACDSDAGSTAASTADAGGDTAGADTTAAGKGYVPFSQANLQNQLARVAAWRSIANLHGSKAFSAADFGQSCGAWSPTATTASDPKKIASLYVETANLSAKVAARKDAHSYAAGAAVGLALDASICQAIAAGAQAGSVAREAVGSIDWHAQVVNKALLHFFYASLYNYLVDGSRKGYDEGVGYYGMSLDGTDPSGLAETAAKRDANCGTTYATQIWQRLRDGRALLDAALKAEGKTGNDDKLSALTPQLKQLAEEIDGLMLEVFALSLGREILGLQKGEEGAVELVEARMFAAVVRPYMEYRDKEKGTTHAAALQALNQDDPSKVDTAAVLAAIKAVWGLDVPQLCKQ